MIQIEREVHPPVRLHRVRRTRTTPAAPGQRIRSELARELHDRVAQPLTAMLLDMEAFRLDASHPDESERRVREFQRQTRAAIAEIRHVLYGLRGEDVLEERFLSRLRGELESERARRPELDVRLSVSPAWPPLIGRRAAEHLLHLLREALHNARVHGHACRVEVALVTMGDGRLELIVTDDGRGLPPDALERPGLGLRGMHERAALLGGELEFSRRADGGTRVRLKLAVQALR